MLPDAIFCTRFQSASANSAPLFHTVIRSSGALDVSRCSEMHTRSAFASSAFWISLRARVKG